MARKYDKWRTAEGLSEIAACYESGMTYQQIADQIGCKRETLMKWIKADETGTMAAATEKTIEPLENAAYACATGDYEYTEETYRPDENGNMVLVERKVKKGQPNPGMIQFMLKNKAPNDYKDKQEIQTDGTVTIRFDGGSGGADWDAISG